MKNEEEPREPWIFFAVLAIAIVVAVNVLILAGNGGL